VAALPEYFIEDMADFLLFLSRFGRNTIEGANVLPIMHLFVTLIANPNYLKNPYLRAKLVEVFCGIAYFQTAHGPGCPSLDEVFSKDPYLGAKLTPALVRLFLDIEHTGGDTQFYDKFDVRHTASVLTKYLMDFPMHLSRMEELATANAELFMRFANCILNDMIYLLDEALGKGTTLCEMQSESVSSLPNSRRREHEREMINIERSLRTAAVFSTHTVSLLWAMCANPTIRQLFLRPEMVERMSQSINHYVVKLVSEAATFKVTGGATDAFKVHQWLDLFTDMYIFFGDSADFLEAVVTDEGSYKIDVLSQAVKVIGETKGKIKEKRQKGTMSVEEKVEGLQAFFDSLEVVEMKVRSTVAELGDIPEHFLDPIMDCFMKDPVKLPTSGVTVDRAVITRHLLNDPSDPFNRNPLTVADLKTDVALLQEMEEWRRSRLRIANAEHGEAQAMDADAIQEPNDV
jgi:ubiquitin conjugation factor E4 B